MYGTCSLFLFISVFLLSPFHLADASSFHYSTSKMSLFLSSAAHASSVFHPSLSLPPCPLLLAFIYRLVHNPCCSNCLHLFAKPMGVLEIVSKAQGLPPTFLSRAQQPLVPHKDRAAELLRWDLRLVMVYSAS